MVLIITVTEGPLVKKAVAPSWLLTRPDTTEELYIVDHCSGLHPKSILLNAGEATTVVFFPSLCKLDKH